MFRVSFSHFMSLSYMRNGFDVERRRKKMKTSNKYLLAATAALFIGETTVEGTEAIPTEPIPSEEVLKNMHVKDLHIELALDKARGTESDFANSRIANSDNAVTMLQQAPESLERLTISDVTGLFRVCEAELVEVLRRFPHLKELGFQGLRMPVSVFNVIRNMSELETLFMYMNADDATENEELILDSLPNSLRNFGIFPARNVSDTFRKAMEERGFAWDSYYKDAFSK